MLIRYWKQYWKNNLYKQKFMHKINKNTRLKIPFSY